MAILTVSSSKDSGKGTIREAIEKANPGDTIRFDSALANKKITLTSGQLDITKDLIIDGADAENLTISGNKSSRIFSVNREKDLTLKNLTIADARAVSGKTSKINTTETAGGGVYVDFFATLSVENTQFNNNVSDVGGGIFVQYGGQATVLNSSFDNNDGTPANHGFSAGAISAAGQTKGLTVKDSRFTNNKGNVGGAVYSLLSPLTIENSSFLDNISTGQGGAIFTDGASPRGKENRDGTISIRNSHFEGNQSIGSGGGLYLYTYEEEKVLIEDSKIIDNTVTKDGIGNALGGGIKTDGGASKGNLTILNTTIENNSSNTGGGLHHGGSKSVNIEDSSLSGNETSSGGAIYTTSGSPIKISDSTIVDNIARDKAGAIWSSGKNDIILAKSTIANNISNNGKQTSFPVKDRGGNEISKPSQEGEKVVAGSQLVDPNLVEVGTSGAEDKAINGIVNLRNVDFDGNGETDEKVSLILEDINSTASNYNSGGFYEVLDLDGTVVDTFTNQPIRPGEEGYEKAALNQRITELEFDADDGSLTTQVEGGTFLAPYLIANGTVEEFIDKNPTNDKQTSGLNAYFSFGNANPDGLEHLKSSDNGFGFEDSYDGGDKDFDDLTFNVNVESA